jgi:hypothetical protein
MRPVRLAFFAILLVGCGPSDQGPAVDHLPVPQHPHLAPNGRSNMHNDAYMTDTYEIDGPAGKKPIVRLKSYSDDINTCVTLAFDRQDRIITTSAAMLEYKILLLDPDSLEVLAAYPLPPRDFSDPLFPYGDTSYDLSDHVVAMEPPAKDHVQMTISDWAGERLWFTTRYGMVGTVEPDSGEVHTIELQGEEMQNSFAVGEDGVYIISDHAMYRFSSDASGAPVVDWRTEYDRGTRIKPSNFNQGSGTTPQLFGEMVAISDNAEPRMNILFLNRSDGNEVCRIPVFAEGLSTTENGLPGLVREGPHGLEYSVIVDNNYGIERDNVLQTGRCWTDHVGGLVRVDLLPDASGDYYCRQVWESPEKSSQVLPKLSLSNGLLYVYTYEQLPDEEYTWYLTAVDFGTGETVFSVPTGEGLDYTNFGPPLIIGPDGTAYLGTMGGLLRIQEGPS